MAQQREIAGLGEGDAGARYPTQKVEDGQVHGYVGNVETFDEPEGGSTNAAGPITAAEAGARRQRAKAAADDQPRGRTSVGVVSTADTGQPEKTGATAADVETGAGHQGETAAEKSARSSRK